MLLCPFSSHGNIQKFRDLTILKLGVFEVVVCQDVLGFVCVFVSLHTSQKQSNFCTIVASTTLRVSLQILADSVDFLGKPSLAEIIRRILYVAPQLPPRTAPVMSASATLLPAVHAPASRAAPASEMPTSGSAPAPETAPALPAPVSAGRPDPESPHCTSSLGDRL